MNTFGGADMQGSEERNRCTEAAHKYLLLLLAL